MTQGERRREQIDRDRKGQKTETERGRDRRKREREMREKQQRGEKKIIVIVGIPNTRSHHGRSCIKPCIL